MTIINNFLIGTFGFLLCASCVYSLSFHRNFNGRHNYKNSTLNSYQKIFFLNSKKEFNVYKKIVYSNNIYFIKSTNSNNYIKIHNLEDFILDNNLNYKIFGNNSEFKLLSTYLLDKKIIKISPGGLYGFYDTGVCSIIKKKYNLDKYIFSGASAGAWNSLFLSYKKDINDLIKSVLEIDIDFNSIKHLQMNLKKKILSSHTTEEFNLKKVFISVCVFDNLQLNNYIYTDFENLEDAIDCCIASSNIPFITGNLIHKYRNKITFDGGFLYYQSFLFAKVNFEINHTIWGRKRFFTSFFDKANTNIHLTYTEGILDTNSNIEILDNEFFNF